MAGLVEAGLGCRGVLVVVLALLAQLVDGGLRWLDERLLGFEVALVLDAAVLEVF